MTPPLSHTHALGSDEGTQLAARLGGGGSHTRLSSLSVGLGCSLELALAFPFALVLRRFGLTLLHHLPQQLRRLALCARAHG